MLSALLIGNIWCSGLVFSYSALEFFNKGESLIEERDYSNAVKYLMKAVDTNPYYADAWRELGKAFFFLGDYPSSISALSNSLKLKSYDLDSILFLGRAYEKMGYDDKSYSIYTSLYKNKKYKNNPDVLFGLIKFKIKRGFFDEALELLNRTKILFPQDYRNYLSMWKIWRKRGNKKKSILYLEKAFELESRNPDVLFALAQEWFDRGKYDKSLFFLNKALMFSPNREDVLKLKAVICFLKENYKCSSALYRNLYEKTKNGFYLMSYAFSLIKQKRIKEAVDCLKEYLDEYPDDEIVRYFLEQIVRSQSDKVGKDVVDNLVKYRLYRAGKRLLEGDLLGSQYEVKRAIKVQPLNKKARLEMVKLWLMRGFKLRAFKDVRVLNTLFNSDVVLSDLYERLKSEIVKVYGKNFESDRKHIFRWKICVDVKSDVYVLKDIVSNLFADKLLLLTDRLDLYRDNRKCDIYIEFVVDSKILQFIVKNYKKQIIFTIKMKTDGLNYRNILDFLNEVSFKMFQWLPGVGKIEDWGVGKLIVYLGRFDGLTNNSVIFGVPPSYDFDFVLRGDFVSHETNYLPVFEVSSVDENFSVINLKDDKGRIVESGWWGVWLPEEFIRQTNYSWVEWRD